VKLSFVVLMQVSDVVQNVPVTNLRFLYDGRRLGDTETPKEVLLFDNYTARLSSVMLCSQKCGSLLWIDPVKLQLV